MAKDRAHDETKKVALVSCTGILGDLIRHSVATLTDVAVVEDVPFEDLSGLAAVLHKVRPDAVVWLLDDESMIADHAELLSADTGWAVVAVLDDGRHSALWELRTSRRSLGTPSMGALTDALHDAAVRS